MHLEEEMTATIEEKDQYIDVLQTQVINYIRKIRQNS